MRVRLEQRAAHEITVVVDVTVYQYGSAYGSGAGAHGYHGRICGEGTGAG
jgi:hypothetical protein